MREEFYLGNHMKSHSVVIALLSVVALSACSNLTLRERLGFKPSKPTVFAPVAPVRDPNYKEPEKIIIGVSSTVVEKLAKRESCTTNRGATRTSEEGPIESYRITCDDGRVLTARCELRQCALGAVSAATK
jgi:hypothetical protein